MFRPGETDVICRKEAAARGSGSRVDLAPGERRALVVRLDGCELPPGPYRYEAWYELGGNGSPEAQRLGPERGRIVVERAAAEIEHPASRRTVSPPEHSDGGAPVSGNPHLRPGAPTRGPAAAACIDRELTRRGLNAFGDPSGTVYPGGPPTLASEVERQRMILERYPDVATLCRIPP